MQKAYLILLLIFCAILTAFSQSESKIKKSKIPSTIFQYLDKNYPEHSSPKFYKEKDNDTIFYEAVFKVKKDKYFLLFDPSGNIYETEITLLYKELPSEVFLAIEKYFKSEFIRYKVNETQEVDQKGKLMYELKVKGKKGKKTSFYEIYFDRKGNFIKIEGTELKTIPTLF